MSHADAHAHDHDHPPFLAHHWETPTQQFEAGKLGMWLFLATEVLFFGGLFCAYTIWRFHNPEMYRFGSEYLDTTMGAINTAVLIASSLTMATAVTMAQLGRKKELIICLVLTLAGALGFLGIKYVEYSHKFHEGFFPGMPMYGAWQGENDAPEYHLPHGQTFDAAAPIAVAEVTTVDTTARPVSIGDLGLPETIAVELPSTGRVAEAPAGMNVGALEAMEAKREGAVAGHADGDEAHDDAHAHAAHPLQRADRPANVHMFFNIYFMMTGLHGIHVLVGVIVIVWLIIRSAKGEFNKDYFTPVDLGGLYWHVVDLIWIFLFPMFYLI